MKTLAYTHLLLTLGACLGLLGCSVSLPPPSPDDHVAPARKSSPDRQNKFLMMHYMPWYMTPDIRGQWGSHWKGPSSQHHPDQPGTNGLPDIWSHYHPLIGPYDSSDPDALECHLLQMKLAGVDGVIADWYGIGQKADHPDIHKATQALFDATGRFGLKFAACYEDRALQLMVDWKQLDPGQVTNELAATFQWMQAEWFTKENYLRVDDHPLLLNFGPVYIQDPAAWNAAMEGLPVRPALFGLHHLWRTAGADGGFTWVHHDPWEGAPDDRQIRTRIGEVFSYFTTNTSEVIVSAFPGFNDVYAERHRELPHRGGQTLRETIEVAMAGPWPIIQLVTWNDYGEGTIIEPTHEFGYTFLEIVQQARRTELGNAFTYTPEDLRLPARLYTLRKEGLVPPTTLDAISRLLANGACEEARKLLDLMGESSPHSSS